MAKISDEIRKWCASENDTECGGFVTKVSFDELSTLADRIDAEDERMDERTKTEQNGVGITDELRRYVG